MIVNKLNILFQGISTEQIIGSVDITINSVQQDSRNVTKNDLFFAISGVESDGHSYIDKAINNGAIAIVCNICPKSINSDVTYIVVADTSSILGVIASRYYGNPSEQLKLIGVTGTNGKTTITTLLHQLVTNLGNKVGLLSTVVNKIGSRQENSTHTTPEPIILNKYLAEMVEEGCSYCFMEVSSHSIVQNRINGLTFCGGVFTNLSHDHLDYHKTFAEYLKAKKLFFDNLPSNAFALVNSDDKNGSVMLQNCKAKKYNFGIRTLADYNAKIIETHFDGTNVLIENNDLWIQFLGDFNVSNILAVYGVANLLGFDKYETLTAISLLRPVDGRFQTIKSSTGVLAIIDYAHTPDALENVLKTISELKNQANVITVVGAGGNRDKTKRPVMAKIAANYSSLVILTSDNPRFEEPSEILKDMEKGIPTEKLNIVLVIEDRKQAIRTACMMAKPGDIVLIAGKGHETYQEIKGTRFHFDDKEEVNNFFNK